MKRLHSLTPLTLGAAAAPSNVAVKFDSARNRWVVGWIDATHRRVQAECAVGDHVWSPPAAGPDFPALAPRPIQPGSLAPDILACVDAGADRIALRSGKRVVGRAPRFPSASLILCREEAGAWRDLGFADEPLELAIETAALAAAPDFLLAAYLVASEAGPVCRVVQLPRQPAGGGDAWRKLPSYPQAPGMAGLMVGLDHGVMIAAGGANFQDTPPWLGGKKQYYDDIYALVPGQSEWIAAGKLAAPRGYGATVTIPGGVLIVGGENGDHVYQDTLILRWDGRRVQIDSGPALPEPVTSAVAVVLGDQVYVASGYGAGQPRLSRNLFWRLNLAVPGAKWEVLPSWPGPSRALAVIAAVGGAVYLMSGIEISAVPGKTPMEAAPGVYHRDAYRYRPKEGWEKLPDLPWSAIAAPSPAPVTESPARVFVLGGVDGRQVGFLPRATVLPDDILCFDVQQNTWRLWPESWPVPVVCIHTIETNSGWIMPSGETMAGRRTTDIGVWRAGA